MLINYDLEKIDKLLEDFYKATDININLLREDFSYVSGRKHRENNCYCSLIQNSPEGKKACGQSDIKLLENCRKTKEVQMHICHAGLIDAAAPILYDDSIIGYVIFGEMKASTNFSSLEKRISDMGFDVNEMKKYYGDIPLFDFDKIQSVSSIASMLAKHILLEDMLKPNFDECVERTVKFIDENLQNDLSVRSLAKNVNVSKSVLYKKFNLVFGCTLSEYINERRIEKSIEYLRRTDLTMEEISVKIGFSSAPYFGKIFKKIKGTTPLKYKKNYKNASNA